MESNLALTKDAEKWEWKMMEHSVESIKGIRFRYFLSFPYGTHADFFAKKSPSKVKTEKVGPDGWCQTI